MNKTIINLDKEYQCSDTRHNKLNIETEDYIIKVGNIDLLDRFKRWCGFLLNTKR